MGLLDDVMSGVLNSLGKDSGASGGPLAQMVTALLQQHGGLGGLLDQLKHNGLEQQVASWVGPGENLPVNTEQLGQALGHGPLAEIAARFGLDAQTMSGSLAQYLPEVVNQLTPDGRLPDTANAGELLERGLSALTGKLFG
ncbi:MAG TPA: YidB family protein [Thiobacillaceae bacterium]|nr:YidB family protein [Thiobacillaceae bacterium]HNU63400.1 YidB family protein [Thiobacillaceae bacterium]